MKEWLNDSRKTMIVHESGTMDAETLHRSVYDLALRLQYAYGESGSIALQIANPLDMLLGVLAGFHTNLRIYLLHPQASDSKIEYLRHRAIPILTELESVPLAPEASEVLECGGASFVFSTSSTSSGSMHWVEIPTPYLVDKSKMLQKMLGIQKDDLLYSVSPINFIQSCWAVIIHLLAGGCVWLDTFSVSKLEQALKSGRVTTMVTVPSIARTMASHIKDFGNLRLLALGGDFADPVLIDDLRRAHPELLVANVYGCTETAAADLVMGPLPLGSGGAECYTIGKPSWYSEVCIRDPADHHILPTGEIGVIWINSPYLCKHYLNSEAPLTTEHGFCSGDLGFVDQEGNFNYCGRNSAILKYNGMKISAIEIESALMAIPGVSDAIAFGLPHEVFGQIPACCVVLSEDLSLSDIVAQLERLLEPYKVPKKIYTLDKLPKTESGKLRRDRNTMNQLTMNPLM